MFLSKGINCFFVFVFFFNLLVICLLEGSGKWPEEVEAIRCLKTLLHIKMGAELKDKHSMLTSIHRDYVDVVKVRSFLPTLQYLLSANYNREFVGFCQYAFEMSLSVAITLVQYPPLLVYFQICGPIKAY